MADLLDSAVGTVSFSWAPSNGSGNNGLDMIFTLAEHRTAISVTLQLERLGSPNGVVTAYIYAQSGGKPTGPALATSSSLNSSSISTSGAAYSFTFNDIGLDAGTYVIVVRCTDTTSGGNAIFVGTVPSSAHSGNMYVDIDGTWTSEPDYDLYFQLYGVGNRYWIAGTSGDWQDPQSWSNSSGGTPGSLPPTSTDAVYFDGNSASGDISINTSATLVCLSFDSSAFTHMISTTAPELQLSGTSILHSFDCPENIYIEASLTLEQTGTIFFLQNVIISNATLTLGTNVNGSLNLSNNSRLVTAGFDITGEVTATGTTGTTRYADISGSVIDTRGYAWTLGNDAYASTLTLLASGSTIIVDKYFWGGGKSYATVEAAGNVTQFSGSNTITTLQLDPGTLVNFGSGTTQTVTNLTVNGTNGNLIKLRSSNAGSKYTLKKFNGTVDANYIDVQDSTVTGGATWNATSSVDSGNNTGWNFIGPQVPVASFTVDDTTPYNSVAVQFTDTSSGIPDTWAWDFGDGNTSTVQNPTHTYTTDGTYTVSLTASNAVGSDSITKTGYITVTTKQYELDLASSQPGSGDATPTFESASLTTGSSNVGAGHVTLLTTFQPLSQKDYEYRVFTHDGQFIGVWQDVISDFGYQQSINQTPTELTVQLGRAPDNLIVKAEPLLDADGNTITDSNNDVIYAWTETPNAVGADTDVEINYDVDVYAFYGGYEQLLDNNGDAILDNNSDPILTQYGAPNGRRVYSGYIADFKLSYGQQTGVTVTVVPHSTETSHIVFKDGSGNTTVSYTGADPVQMARDAMDNYASQGGVVTYDDLSMPLSGNTADYDFKLQTTRETIDKTIALLPSGYYQFVDPGENKQYLLQKGAAADHVFYYEQHLSQLTLEKSLTQLVNKVYFVGGDTGSGTDLFAYDEDDTSIADWRPGLDRQSDARVTLAASAHALNQQEIDQFNAPRYRTSFTITDAVYDIESIKLGQMVGFKNFGTFVDDLILQIVTINRAKHDVTIDLDMVVPSDTKRLYELKKELQTLQVRNIADAPV